MKYVFVILPLALCIISRLLLIKGFICAYTMANPNERKDDKS